jgi:predicted Zn-dependent protease
MLSDGRPGEAIGPLRRAANLGAAPAKVWALLAQAFAARKRHLAALGAVLEARAAGATPSETAEVVARVKGSLGDAYERWEAVLGSPAE